LRRWAAHIGLLLLGCALALVALEAVLQLASLTLRGLGYRAEALGRRGERRILCVGDSHTYGTSVPRAEAYPAQLEAYLGRADPEHRYQVVNRGVPGMNSAQLAGVLPLWLAQSDPQLAVVWIGTNNWWNRAEDPIGGDGGGGLARTLGGLRLPRLLQTLRIDAAWRDSLGDPDAVFAKLREQMMPSFYRKEARSEAEFVEVTLHDLARIEHVLRRAGVDWLLVTYPLLDPTSRDFPLSVVQVHARAVQRFQQNRPIGVVDTTLDLSRARAANATAIPQCLPATLHEQPCLFVNEMGPHPSGLLYGYIAESIGREILARFRAVDRPE
jgi:lysophospholipase L1-like esterase